MEGDEYPSITSLFTGVPADVCTVQDAKAFMVAWKGGRQVADVPRIKLNLPPGSWLGLTTAAGLAVALWFARTHTKPLEEFFNEVINPPPCLLAWP